MLAAEEGMTALLSLGEGVQAMQLSVRRLFEDITMFCPLARRVFPAPV